MTNLLRTKHITARLLIGLALAWGASGCAAAPAATPTTSGSPTAVLTRVALAPSQPTLTTTPRVDVVEATAVPVALKDFHPDLEEAYTLQYDATLWNAQLVGSGPRLVHVGIPDCYIVDTTYSDTGHVRAQAPERVYLAGLNWNITNGIFYSTADDQIHLELGSVSAHQDAQCKQDQEDVLSTLSNGAELFPTEVPFPTYTPLPEYYCPQAPEPRLKEGDEAITTLEVLLRSTPEKLSDNVIRTVASGVRVKLEEGPLCGEFPGGAYVYWRVTIVKTGEEGWMAEAGYNKYYLKKYEAPQP